MPSQQSIQILPSKNIDKTKWNACVKGSANTMMYAEFDYLQLITDNWCAIVANDYEAVMPLPFRNKWGIRYCYDVPFVQQLGLFGRYDANLLKEVIQCATKYISYGDLYFNFENKTVADFLQIQQADNYVLPLFSSYPTIYSNYNKHLQTKLKTAQKNKLLFRITDDVEASVAMFQQLYSQKMPQIKNKNYQQLQTLAQHFLFTQHCFVAEVYNEQNNTLAIALFFKDDNRIYNILPSTSAEGRKLNAMHYLLDTIIQQNAETRMMLDFEGSDVPGIKAFYQSFGAVNQPYFHCHFNHLPLPLRWFKK